MLIVEQKVLEVLEICHRVYSIKLGRVAFSFKDEKHGLPPVFPHFFKGYLSIISFIDTGIIYCSVDLEPICFINTAYVLTGRANRES